MKTWCPQCGPWPAIDEDGCCLICGCDSVGDGAEAVHERLESALAGESAALEEAAELKTKLLALHARHVRYINGIGDALKYQRKYRSTGEPAHSDAYEILSLGTDAMGARMRENEVKKRLILTAQILIDEIGADGPTNAESAAAEAVQLIKNLRAK